MNEQRQQKSSDEFDPHVLWRERKGFGGSRIFSPRVLMVDLRENFTKSSARNENQESSKSKSVLDKEMRQAESFWDGKIEKIYTGANEGVDEGGPTQTKSKGLDTTCTWGDYTKCKLDESQQFSIPNFAYHSEKGELSTYSQGLDIWKLMEEDIWDGVRRYAEDCDRLQVKMNIGELEIEIGPRVFKAVLNINYQ